MRTIVFIGDSITDTGRIRTLDESFGSGYAFLLKAMLSLEHPGVYSFYNRGLNNDRITDVYARMKKDIINLKPDILSILIGVNDAWRDAHDGDGVDAEKYYKIYSMLIEEVKAILPEIKIIILEPFILRTDFTAPYWEELQVEVPKRAQKARDIAEKYHLSFVPLQNKFDELTKICPCEYWLKDGVHPTPAGHEIIKREWIKALR